MQDFYSNFYDKFKGKKIALYVEGHRYPFVGKLIEARLDYLVLDAPESNKLILFRNRIVGLFEYEENKKYIESER